MKGAIRKGFYLPLKLMISNDEEVLEEILSHKQINVNKFSVKKNSFPSRSLHICLPTDRNSENVSGSASQRQGRWRHQGGKGTVLEHLERVT